MKKIIQEKEITNKCPKCKRLAVGLVSLYDDGNGTKLCVTCKRDYRKQFPNKDFSKIKKSKK